MLKSKINSLLLLLSFCISAYAVQDQSILISKHLDQTALNNIIHLHTEGQLTVMLKQSPVNGVFLLKGNPADVNVSIEGFALKIRQKKSLKKMVLAVHLKQLDQIKSEGDFTLRCLDKFKSDHLNFALSGMNAIDFKNLEAGHITATTSGISIMNLQGKANQVKIDFKGFGMVDHDSLLCSNINVKHHGFGLLTSFAQFLELFKV